MALLALGRDKIEGVYLPGIGGVVFEGVKPPGAIFSPGKFLDSIDVLDWHINNRLKGTHRARSPKLSEPRKTH